MISFLKENLASIVILLILAASVGLVIFKIIKNKRHGKSSCSCGFSCSSCPMGEKCNPKKDEQDA